MWLRPWHVITLLELYWQRMKRANGKEVDGFDYLKFARRHGGAPFPFTQQSTGGTGLAGGRFPAARSDVTGRLRLTSPCRRIDQVTDQQARESPFGSAGGGGVRHSAAA